MAKYLINNLKTHLSVAENKHFVPVGGWIELTDHQADHPEVVEAVRIKWAELTDKKPKPFKEIKPELKIEESPIVGSLKFPTKKKETA